MVDDDVHRMALLNKQSDRIGELKLSAG
ncbi:MAG: hypothetical protein JWQ31_4247, partial [Mycobacterium sp.]|nr:hypothetical protein [Mycobacterium sp.]